jgi:hypothetical protein
MSIVFRITQDRYDGSMPRPASLHDHKAARRWIARLLRQRRRAGYRAQVVERGWCWEVLAPADAEPDRSALIEMAELSEAQQMTARELDRMVAYDRNDEVIDHD